MLIISELIISYNLKAEYLDREDMEQTIKGIVRTRKGVYFSFILLCVVSVACFIADITNKVRACQRSDDEQAINNDIHLVSDLVLYTVVAVTLASATFY